MAYSAAIGGTEREDDISNDGKSVDSDPHLFGGREC